MEEDFRRSVERIDEIKNSRIMKELVEVYKKGMKIIEPEEISGAIRGRNLLLQQLEGMFRNAVKKINIITTPEGLKDIFSKHFDVLREAKERGVQIKILTSGGRPPRNLLKSFSSIAEIRIADPKTLPIKGRFAIVDGKELVFALTNPQSVHFSQDLAFWSRSEHVAREVLGPLFDLAWSNSKKL